MSWWPFGKGKDHNQPEEGKPVGDFTAGAPATEASQGTAEVPPAQPAEPAAEEAQQTATSAPTTVSGPFDGDTVDIEDFDFTDFSNGLLNLGSMKLPLPKKSQVQLEMGDNGPRMLHIVTEFGRITPVAFAAARGEDQWDGALQEIADSMEAEGLTVTFDEGPWGRELQGRGDHDAIMRIMGIDGPRWMLRFTLVGPADSFDNLVELARELAARTFVYRGGDPMLAGNSLPIALPQPLVDQVNQAMQQRQAAAQPPTENSADDNTGN